MAGEYTYVPIVVVCYFRDSGIWGHPSSGPLGKDIWGGGNDIRKGIGCLDHCRAHQHSPNPERIDARVLPQK